MQTHRIKVFLLVCIAFYCLTGAGWDNLLVKSIDVVGNRKIEKEAILYKLKTKLNQPFNSQQIEEDIKAIYEIGYFEDIRVDIQEIEEGLALTYLLKERPLIKKISFQGNKEISNDTLQEKISIKTGTVFNPFLVEQNLQNLLQYYRDEGHYLIKIITKTAEISPGSIELIFKVKEGSKIKIKKIQIKGNKSYSDKKLKKVLGTKKYGLFSFFTSSGYLKKDTLSQDVLHLEDFYLDHGYIHVEVQEPEIFFDKKQKGLFITISLSEGNQFRNGQILLEGNTILPSQEIKKRIKIQSEELFSRSQLRKDIAAIQDLYAEHGYLFTRIIPLTQESIEQKKVDITYRLEEGELSYIDHILISGNIKTRDKVIRREVGLQEGDIFDSRKIRESYNNINNLGFFEEVNLDIQPVPSNNKVDLVIKVKERMTGQVSVGGGWSSQENFVGTAEIKQGNLFGLGQRLSFSAEIAPTSRSTYDIGFTEPWLFDIPLSAGFDLYYVEKKYEAFDKIARGGDVQLGYPVANHTYLFGTYLLENVRINIDESENVSQEIKDAEGKSRTSSMRLALNRDSRDNRIKPTYGSINKISFQVAGGLLGGSNHFYKTIGESAWHFKIWKELIFSVHGKIGYASEFREDGLPIFERFYCGGLDTVRGYEERSIGPTDPNTNDPVGGNKMVITNIELAFPLVDVVRGVFFFDAGNVYSENGKVINERGHKVTNSEYFFDTPLRMGAGVGIRFFTPIGPLRLDWGHKIHPEDGESPSEWHFAIGTYF